MRLKWAFCGIVHLNEPKMFIYKSVDQTLGLLLVAKNAPEQRCVDFFLEWKDKLFNPKVGAYKNVDLVVQKASKQIAVMSYFFKTLQILLLLLIFLLTPDARGEKSRNASTDTTTRSSTKSEGAGKRWINFLLRTFPHPKKMSSQFEHIWTFWETF